MGKAARLSIDWQDPAYNHIKDHIVGKEIGLGHYEDESTSLSICLLAYTTMHNFLCYNLYIRKKQDMTYTYKCFPGILAVLHQYLKTGVLIVMIHVLLGTT